MLTTTIITTTTATTTMHSVVMILKRVFMCRPRGCAVQQIQRYVMVSSRKSAT